MIRRQTLIALGIALVLGLLAVYLANMLLTRGERSRGMGETTKVAVAAVPLDFGVEVTADKVKLVDYPTASLPPGAFSSIAQMLPAGKRRVALRPITVNEPILASKLSVEGEGASIAALLPSGMRAVSVRINDISGVAGFVQPNDSVDVLVTRNLTTGNRSEQVTDVLMQNVKVLALGQNAKENNQPTVAQSATLQVDPVDAQKLALAEAVGSLSLVLRKPGEEENSPVVQTVSIDDLRYGRFAGRAYVQSSAQSETRPTPARAVRRQVARPIARRPVVVRPTTRSVEVVRGTQNSNYEVGGYGS
ncbi:MAG TPA: Flp pilus assembly protein CpaB [Sphingomicrobium sp.]|nr:Flp pilus assembly protein CpaB [Sphingomicrobium sp.]